MKKIIAAFDGLKYSAATAEYAVNIAKQARCHLTGIFLDDLIYHSYRFSDLISATGALSEKKIKEFKEKDAATRKQSISLFKKVCERAGVEFSIHHDKNVAAKDLLHESVYSDLLIISKKESFTTADEESPTNFIQDVLADVQCPVLVTPVKYKPFQSVIFLYDGEPSSVHAVKMFNYDFDSLKNLPAKVLSVKPLTQSLHLPDNRLMKEFMKNNFPKAKYIVLKGEAENTILTYLQQEVEEALVVLGAYRRSRVSRWFRQSMADFLMKHTNHSLFIAHNK